MVFTSTVEKNLLTLSTHPKWKGTEKPYIMKLLCFSILFKIFTNAFNKK